MNKRQQAEMLEILQELVKEKKPLEDTPWVAEETSYDPSECCYCEGLVDWHIWDKQRPTIEHNVTCPILRGQKLLESLEEKK